MDSVSNRAKDSTAESLDRETEQGQKRHENPLPCGCGIKGTPYLDPLGTRGYEYKNLFIDFCPVHAAAPALYEALRNLVNCKWVSGTTSKHVGEARAALALADKPATEYGVEFKAFENTRKENEALRGAAEAALNVVSGVSLAHECADISHCEKCDACEFAARCPA